MKKNELCLAGSSCLRIGKLFRLQTSSILASIRVSGHFRPEYSPMMPASCPRLARPSQSILRTRNSSTIQPDRSHCRQQSKQKPDEPTRIAAISGRQQRQYRFPRTGQPAHRRTHQERSRKPHQREAENLHHGSTHRQCTHGQL